MLRIRLQALLLPALLLLCTLVAAAEEKENRVLIIIDGSSSMLENWGKDQNRYKTASAIVLRLMDSIYHTNDRVEFGLRVYGHQSPAQDNNCYDSKLEVAFSKNNYTQMSLRLESLHPYGISPIAYSLKEAAEKDLVNLLHYNYSIILITDGGESCNGDICAVAKTLLSEKINFKPYVIGLVDYAPLKDQYRCLGTYMQAAKESDIPVVLDTIIKAYRRFIPYSVTVKTAPVKRIPPAERVAPPRQKETTLRLDVKPQRIFPVFYEIPTPAEIKITRRDTIPDYGFTKFTGFSSEFFLSYWTQGEFKFYKVIKPGEMKKGERLKFPTGTYKVIYNKKTTKYGTETFKVFSVQKNVLTEVDLN